MAEIFRTAAKFSPPTACGRSPSGPDPSVASRHPPHTVGVTLAEGAKEFCDKRGGEGLFLFTVPMMHGLQLELKVAGILGKLAREDDARDKQQQRRHQHKAADDQSREARHKAGPEILAQHPGS